MIRVPVKSSNLNEVGYDAGTRTLEVQFKNGQVWQYLKVPSDVHARVIGAGLSPKEKAEHSVGKTFGQLVRGMFGSQRVLEKQP